MQCILQKKEYNFHSPTDLIVINYLFILNTLNYKYKVLPNNFNSVKKLHYLQKLRRTISVCEFTKTVCKLNTSTSVCRLFML